MSDKQKDISSIIQKVIFKELDSRRSKSMPYLQSLLIYLMPIGDDTVFASIIQNFDKNVEVSLNDKKLQKKIIRQVNRESLYTVSHKDYCEALAQVFKSDTKRSFIYVDDNREVVGEWN